MPFFDNYEYINEFMFNDHFSLHLKSWFLFKVLYIDFFEVVCGTKPWCDPLNPNYDMWQYQSNYGNQPQLDYSEGNIFWIKLMDMWYDDCFDHEHIVIKRVSFFENRRDIGVFTKGLKKLDCLSQKIHGFIEPITKAVYDELKSRDYPSLYATNEIDERTSIPSKQFQGYILYGLLSCINSNQSSQNKFAHRCMVNDCILKWEFEWKSPTLTSRSNEYEIEYVECDYDQCINDHLNKDVILCSSNTQYTIRNVYVQRIMFGHWCIHDGEWQIDDYCYDHNEEVVVCYDYM